VQHKPRSLCRLHTSAGREWWRFRVRVRVLELVVGIVLVPEWVVELRGEQTSRRSALPSVLASKTPSHVPETPFLVARRKSCV
jgi:hypothetical protein